MSMIVSYIFSVNVINKDLFKKTSYFSFLQSIQNTYEHYYISWTRRTASYPRYPIGSGVVIALKFYILLQ